MDYGSILILTTSWQTSTKIKDYADGNAYFSLFGEQCRCDLYDPVIMHETESGWEPFDRAKNVVHVFTPGITVKEKSKR